MEDMSSMRVRRTTQGESTEEDKWQSVRNVETASAVNGRRRLSSRPILARKQSIIRRQRERRGNRMPFKTTTLKPANYTPPAPRLSAYQRGYDRRWREASKWFLRRNLMCMCPQCQGKGLPADCVDHIVPHRGDKALFWDQS